MDMIASLDGTAFEAPAALTILSPARHRSGGDGALVRVRRRSACSSTVSRVSPDCKLPAPPAPTPERSLQAFCACRSFALHADSTVAALGLPTLPRRAKTDMPIRLFGARSRESRA